MHSTINRTTQVQVFEPHFISDSDSKGLLKRLLVNRKEICGLTKETPKQYLEFALPDFGALIY